MLIPKPATQDDLPYILDSFANEYSRSVYADGLPRAQVRQLLVTLLSKPNWNCTVLCESEVPDEILGYCVWLDPQHIAWLQVKGRYRHQGVAHKLLAAIGAAPGPIKATFLPSPAFSRAARSQGWILHHRPYLGLS